MSLANQDKTIYNFINKDGRTFTGTQYNLRKQENLPSNHLGEMVSGKFKTHYGWSLNNKNYV